MKKNLRIVSAAAAALLAVAPVAATVVPAASTTVSADATADYNGSVTVPRNVEVPNAGLSLDAFAKKLTSGISGEFISNGFGKINLNATAWDNVTAYEATDNKKTEVTHIKNATAYRVNGTVTLTLANTKSNSGFVGKKIKVGNQILTVQANNSKDTAYVDYKLDNVLVGTTIPNAQSYFATNEGELANNATVDASYQKAEGWGFDYDKLNNTNALKQAVQAVLSYSKVNWTEVWSNSASLKSQLEHQGISVDANGNFNAGNKAYTITVRTANGLLANVRFENTDAEDTTKPVILYRHSSTDNWERLVTKKGYVHALNLKQSDQATNFQPSQYFTAWQNAEQRAYINVTFSNNNVDLTKAGLYHITVSATNAAGKTEVADVPVIVSARNGKMMTVVNNTNVYSINNGTATQANLTDFYALMTAGSQVEVYGSPVTAKLNGQDTQFYRVASPNANLYVPASALKDGVVSTPAQETTKTVTIMHISTVYDKNGKATTEPALRAYDTYSVVSEPVTINGAKFYKLAGKDQYIKVGNVDGTSRSLKHNSYVYKSTGKRANKKTLKKGSSVTTYGKSFMIAGHQMYRIGKNQYVKKANF